MRGSFRSGSPSFRAHSPRGGSIIASPRNDTLSETSKTMSRSNSFNVLDTTSPTQAPFSTQVVLSATGIDAVALPQVLESSRRSSSSVASLPGGHPAAAHPTAEELTTLDDLGDLDTLQDRLDNKNFLSMYRDGQLEQAYTRHYLGRMRGLSAFAVMIAVGYIGVTIAADFTSRELTMAIIHFVVSAVCFVVAVANLKYCVPNAGKLAAARLHEKLGVVCSIFSISNALMSQWYSKACLEDTTNLPENDKARNCQRHIYPHAIVVIMSLCVLIRMRPIITVPCALLAPVFYLLGYAFFQGVDGDAYAFNATVHFVVTALACVFNIALDRDARFAFENNVRRQFYEVRSLRRQTELDATLANLLPKTVLSRLARQEPVIDIAASGAVSVCELYDFVQWSTSLLPQSVFQVVNMIYSTFDAYANKARLEKLKAVGDQYICGLGVQNVATAGDVSRLIKFGLRQIRSVQKLKETEEYEPPALRIAVHMGHTIGAIIGMQSFSYEVFGPTIATAQQVLRYAGAGELVATKPTLEGHAEEFILKLRTNLPADLPDVFTIERVNNAIVSLSNMNSSWSTIDTHPQDDPFIDDASVASFREERRQDPIRYNILLKRLQKLRRSENAVNFVEHSAGLFGRDLFTFFADGLADTKRSWLISTSFADQAFQRGYSEYVAQAEKKISMPSMMVAIGFVFSLLILAISEIGIGRTSHSTAPIIGLALVIVLLFVRGAYVQLLHPPPFEQIVLPFFAIATYASVGSMKDYSVLNGEYQYLNVMFVPIIAYNMMRVPGIFVVLSLLIGTVIPFFVTSHLSQGRLPSESLVVVPIWFMTGIYIVREREEHYLRRFIATTLSLAALQSAEDEMNLQQEVLLMMFPEHVAAAVIDQATATPSALYVQSFGEVCCLRIRLDRIRATTLSDLTLITGIYEGLESMLASSSNSIRLVHVVGDEFLVCGPLTKENVAAIAESDLARRQEHETKIIQSALNCVDVVVGMTRRSPVELTTVCTSGGAFGAVIGSNRLAFDVIGVAVREAQALMAAADPGVSVVSDGFRRLLASTILPTGVQFGTPMTWRVRGIGSRQVYSMNVEDAVMADESTEIPSPTEAVLVSEL